MARSAFLSPALAPRLAGIENADSIALDFHKWGQVPYDAGFLLVRDGQQHRETFAAPAAYLRRETRGLAAGSPWPCDLGPDLSRGFRALKTWFTLKTYGTEKLGAMITRTCALAGYLEARILAEPRLELLAPVQLNIVCFRYRAADANQVNGDIVVDIQESGIAAPSTTVLDGQLAIRAAIVNHRTDTCDIDALIAAVLEFGAQRSTAVRSRRPSCCDVEPSAAAGDVSGRVSRTGACRFATVRRNAVLLRRRHACRGLRVIQQLLLVGDELPGFLQRLVQIAAQDVVVDALDDRPRARRGGDDVAHQIEVGAVIDLRVRRNIHQLHRQIDQLGRRVGGLRASGCPFRAGSESCRRRSAAGRADRYW